MAIAGHIVANLTANTTGWSSGLRGAIGPLNAVAAVITGMAAAAVNRFATFGDEIDKMRSRTGLTAVELSQLSHAAGLSDTSLASLQNGLTKMQRFMREASQGGATATGVLNELGLSAEQLQTATNNEKLGLFADALARIDDPGQRAAVAMDIFGKGAVDLLPLLAGGSAGLRQMTDEADRLGLTMSDEAASSAALLNDTIGRLKGMLGGLVTTVGADLAPMVISVVSQFTEWVAQNRGLIILLAKTAIVMASVVGALKLITFATQAYAKAQAVASALSGPAGWAKLAIGIGVAAGATALLASEFESTNRTLDASSMAAEQSRSAFDFQAETFGDTEKAISDYASGIRSATDDIYAANDAINENQKALKIKTILPEFDANSDPQHERSMLTKALDVATVATLNPWLVQNRREAHRTAHFDAEAKAQSDALAAEVNAILNDKNEADASIAEAIKRQAAAAGTFAARLTETTSGLRTSAQTTSDDIRTIMSEWFAAGSATKMRLEEINALTQKLAQNKSGFTNQFEDVQNELRVLRGEITETGIAFEKMAEFGVNEGSLNKLAAMTAERDRLLGEQAAKEKAAEEKRSEMQAEQDKLAATKNKVFEANDTPYAAFAREAKEVQDAIAAGYVKEADGLKYLEDKRAEFLAQDKQKADELAAAEAPKKQASNVGLDSRSQQANQMIVDLVNRRGAAKDSNTEARKLAAAEAARVAAEASAKLLTDIRDEQRRREHLETRPFGQRGQNG